MPVVQTVLSYKEYSSIEYSLGVYLVLDSTNIISYEDSKEVPAMHSTTTRTPMYNLKECWNQLS